MIAISLPSCYYVRVYVCVCVFWILVVEEKKEHISRKVDDSVNNFHVQFRKKCYCFVEPKKNTHTHIHIYWINIPWVQRRKRNGSYGIVQQWTNSYCYKRKFFPLCSWNIYDCHWFQWTWKHSVRTNKMNNKFQILRLKKFSKGQKVAQKKIFVEIFLAFFFYFRNYY